MQELSRGLVGHWTLDTRDTSNGTVRDRTPYDTEGSLNGGVTTGVSAPVGQGYSFDGTDDYVDLSDSRWSNPFAETSETGAFTVTAWVNPDELVNNYTDAASGAILGQRYGTSMVFGVRDTGALFLSLDDTRASSPESTGTISVGTWHHVAVTYEWDSDLSATPYGEATFYIDGKHAGTATNDDDSAVGTDSSLAIGCDFRDNMFFAGQVSEVRVYTRVLDATEVSVLYNTRNDPGVNPRSTETGLVGRWTMDDADSDNGTLRDRGAHDLHATLYNGVTTGASAPVGEGYTFDGVDDEVVIPYDSALDITEEITIAGWVKHDIDPDETTDNEWRDIISHGGSYRLLMEDQGAFSGSVYIGGERLKHDAPSSYFTVGAWHHVVYTHVGATGEAAIYVDGELANSNTFATTGTFDTTTDTLSIADSGGNGARWEGDMGGFRLYDRALSLEEVKDLYNEQTGSPSRVGIGSLDAGLVGHWTMDDAQIDDGVVYDQTGFGFDATIHDNTGGLQTGQSAPLGESIAFDASNNVSGTDLADADATWLAVPERAEHKPTDALTVAGWVYSNGTQSGNGGSMVWRGHDKGYGVEPRGNEVRVNYGGEWAALTGSLPHGEWSHWTFVYDNGTATLYRNGSAVDSRSDLTLSYSESGETWIGRRNGHHSHVLDGRLDDVRIYRRALDATEIEKLYKRGQPR